MRRARDAEALVDDLCKTGWVDEVRVLEPELEAALALEGASPGGEVAVVTLAALELELEPYRPERVEGPLPGPGRPRAPGGASAELSVAKRRALPGMKVGRADVSWRGSSSPSACRRRSGPSASPRAAVRHAVALRLLEAGGVVW